MGKISIWSISGLLLGCLIFILSPSFNELFTNINIWHYKELSLYLTGSIAIVYMVMSMVLSVRFSIINNYAGGLDKAYKIHKWVGIWAFVSSIVHWFTETWFIDICKLFFTLPPKVKGVSTISDFAKQVYHIGNDMVEYAFYAFVIVLVISLIKKVPYHIFRYIHKTIPVLFLFAAYHSFTIQIKGAWFGSIGSFMLSIIIFIGVVCALIDLLQLIGYKHKVFGEVVKYSYNENNKTMVIDIKTMKPFDFKAGQYVFLRFGHKKEPHPFSIAGCDKENNVIRFIIKELGDYTKALKNSIKVTDVVLVEGPYGTFTFESTNQQIWVAGGIGITPFIARLEYLAAEGKKVDNIDFYYSGRGENPFKEIEELSQKTGVRFHYIDTSKEGRLSFDKIKDAIKDITNVTLWYCGPEKFGETIQESAKNNGISSKQIHYDSFDMR